MLTRDNEGAIADEFPPEQPEADLADDDEDQYGADEEDDEDDEGEHIEEEVEEVDEKDDNDEEGSQKEHAGTDQVEDKPIDNTNGTFDKSEGS